MKRHFRSDGRQPSAAGPRAWVALAFLVGTLVLGRAAGLSQRPPQPPPGSSFAASIARLSEPSGYFDTDNLISNERSYLQVIPALQEARVTGGAYIGVGPDQNFSYIAQVKPTIAFIIDIRRDNLLLQLLFKALFELGDDRATYLSLLTGRPAPSGPEWRDASLERLAAYIDSKESVPSSVVGLEDRVKATIARFGVPLTPEDFQTIERFHRTFIEAGLSLKFQSLGRAPREAYPTYRDLLLETDRPGRHWNYLVAEPEYQRVRELETKDLIIPVVGDLSGPHAVRAIGMMMAGRGDRLSAFYVSNIEDYLFRGGTFSRFVDNLGHLPRSDRSVVIRSIFGGGRDITPGYLSTSAIQGVDELLSEFAHGKYRSYWDLLAARSAFR